jgi:hypothetical protein
MVVSQHLIDCSSVDWLMMDTVWCAANCDHGMAGGCVETERHRPAFWLQTFRRYREVELIHARWALLGRSRMTSPLFCGAQRNGHGTASTASSALPLGSVPHNNGTAIRCH